MEVKIISYEEAYKDQVIELIFNILENEFGHHGKSGRPDVKNISEHYQKDPLSNFWVAIGENNEVIGTIALSDVGEGMGYLQRLMVKKEFRRDGVGRKLLEHLLNFAKSTDYKEIYLSTSEDMIDANRFYLKNGFIRIDSLPEESGNRSSWDNVFYKLEIK